MRLIKDEERESLRQIFENEFDSLLPEPEQSHIVTDDEGSLVTLEFLLRANMWRLDPKHRGTVKGSILMRNLMKYILKTVPKGTSIVVLASNEKQARLCRKVGLRKCEGTLYRIDR